MAGNVTIKILGDASQFKRTIDQTDAQVGGLAGRIKSKMGGLKSAFSPTAVAGIAAGGAAVTAFGISSVKAFAEAETQQAKLSAAFKKFPQLAGGNIQALRRLNTELAKKTVYDDDATAAAQATLAGFGLTEEQLRELTPLLQDYASRTGKDLPSAATDLGKAIMGQGRALKNIGVDFKDTGTEAGNFESLITILAGKVGGFAENEATTAEGKVKVLKNRFGELQEEIGAKLMPKLLELSGWLMDTGIPAIGDFSAEWTEKMRNLGADLEDIWIDKIQPVMTLWTEAWRTFGGAVYDAYDAVFGNELRDNPTTDDPIVDLGSGRQVGKRAAGGPVSAYGTYLVGENGPEMLTMGSRSGSITPNAGMTNNITINASSPDAWINDLLWRLGSVG